MFRVNRKVDPHSPAGNALSIDQIPSSHISDEDRAAYRGRALAGEDVYAYHSGPGDEGVWNIWDTDTRIAQPPLEKRWHIDGCANEPSVGMWLLRLSRGNDKRVVSFFVRATSDAHAQRKVFDIINHCAQFDIDPDKLEGTQH